MSNYVRPMCDCGGELLEVCDEKYRVKRVIKENGFAGHVVSQIYKDYSETGAHFECAKCKAKYYIGDDEEGRYVRGERMSA